MSEANAEPTHEALLAQLAQLNERSRTYGRQFWQVPYSYIAASGVVLAQLAEKDPPAQMIALVAIAVIGGLTIWHLIGLCGAAKRCFRAIRKVEGQLSLSPEDTRWTAGHLIALVALTALMTLASLGAALYLACTNRQ